MPNSQILKCRTLIAGGGLYGCGFAAAFPDAVLVEEGNVPGGDFLLSLKQYRDEDFSVEAHLFAKEFQTSLRERNAFTEDGLLRPGALAPELYAWLYRRGVKLLLGAALFRSEEGVLLLAGGEGVRRVECETFYDLRNRYDHDRKFYHALIDFCGSDVICGDFPGFTLQASAVPGYAVLGIELEAAGSWTEARRKLRALWSGRPDVLAAGRIAWSAAAFSHDRYPGPLHALDAGLREGEAMQ